MVPILFTVRGVISASRWFLTDKSSSSGIGWVGNEYSLVGRAHRPLGTLTYLG